MVGPSLDQGLAASALQADDLTARTLKLEQLRQGLKAGRTEEQGLKKACDGFEALFMNKLWQQMRQTVSKEGYLHGKEEEAYLGLFDQELSMKMAEAGGMGLGRQLFEQLKQRLTEAGSITPSISRRPGPEDLNPLRPEAAERRLNPLRPEAGALQLKARPASFHDEPRAQAAELARRIIQEHGQEPAGDDD